MEDVGDPMASFAKSGQAITGTVKTFKIIALTDRGHCISSKAAPTGDDATLSHMLCMKEEEEDSICLIASSTASGFVGECVRPCWKALTGEGMIHFQTQ